MVNLNQRSYSTLSRVSTEMGDRLLLYRLDIYLTNHQANSAWPSFRE